MFWAGKNKRFKKEQQDKHLSKDAAGRADHNQKQSYPHKGDEESWHSRDMLSEPHPNYGSGSKEYFQTLLESLREVAFEMEADGRITYISPSLTKLLGFLPETLSGSHLADWIHPEDKGVFHLMMRDLQREPYGKFEFRMKKREGDYHWVRSALTPVIENKEIIRARGCLVDIQERKLAEEAIRMSEEKFRTLFTHSPDAYVILVDDTFVEVNQAAIRLYGKGGGALVGKTPAMISPEYQPNGRKSSEYSRELLARACLEQAITFEWLYVREDGSTFLGSVSLSCLAAKEKKIYFASWRDISDSKRMQLMLEESEERFRVLADHSGIIVWEVDMEGRCTYVSDGIRTVLGYPPEEVVGKSFFFDLLPEEIREEYKAIRLQLLQSGESIRGHINPTVTIDGKVRWLNTSALPLRGEDGAISGYRGTGADVTEVLELQKSLEKQNKKLNAIINAIPDLLFVIDREGIIRDYHIQEKGVTYVPEEEIVGTALSSLFDEKTAREQMTLIHDCLEQEERFDYTYSMLISGEITWFEARFLPWEEDRVMAFVRKLGGGG